MNRVAEFMHVSGERFCADWADALDGARAPQLPPLPMRATSGSAGYDFFAPEAFELAPGENVRIPTGVRARIDEGWVLMLFPRSGLGFKYRLRLDNTVGVIDSDYFGAKNEGHIFVKLTNEGSRTLRVEKGEAFAQGIFLPFGITVDDEAKGVRVGGFGSTNTDVNQTRQNNI